MSDFLFNYPIQSFEQRAFVRQQLEDNKRAQVLGLEGRKAQERANEILREGFGDLVESTRDSVQAMGAPQIEYVGDDLSSALDNVSAELEGVNRNIDEGLSRIDKTLVGGFAATNLVLGVGFTALHQKLEECTEEVVDALNEGFGEVVQSIDEGFRDVRETLDEGFGEISSLLDDVKVEISDTRASIDSGFEKLGALFDWGFSGLIAQAELQNEKLGQIIKILLKPVTTEARDLFSHAVNNYQRRFTAAALESFSYLLEEKKYRVVFSTYFPIYRFMADIYFFDGKDYDKAREYYELTLKYTPEEENTQRLRSLLHLCIGHCHYFKKEFVQAIGCAEKSLKTKYSTEAEYQLAQYCALSGEKDKALSHLKSVLSSDRKYIFRVLQEPDFVSIKKEIQQFLIWMKRIRDLRNLKLKIIEIKKNIRQEIEKNRQPSIDSGVLKRWSSILERVIKIIDRLDEEFKTDSLYSLSWAKKSQSCQGSIYRIRCLIRASHALLKSNELQKLEKEKQEEERRKKEEEQRAVERKRRAQEAERREKAEEQKEIERSRKAQEEQKKREAEAHQEAQEKAKKQAEIKKIETEVSNYQKELAEKESSLAGLVTGEVVSLVVSIICLATGSYHLVELVSFDPKKNEIEIVQKESEWQQAKQNRGFFATIFGNTSAEDEIASEIVYLQNRKIILFGWTMIPIAICVFIIIFVLVELKPDTKKLQLLLNKLRDKKSYIEQCKEWLKKQT